MFLGAVLGLLFLCFGCRTSTQGNLEASSADGMGVSWGVTFTQDAPARMLSPNELIRGADLIARAEVVSNRPVNFKYKGTTYYQLTLLNIKEVIKGKVPSEVITLYAREDNLPPECISAYELCDEVLVFLKESGGFYFTYGGAYGQMPICDERILNWRKVENGKLEEDIIISYQEAKQFIIVTLYVNSLGKNLERKQSE